MIYDVVCPYCGCLCDDIAVTVENGKITKIRNACAISRSTFLHHDQNRLSPSIGNKTVSVPEAVEEAGEILASADYPLIYGLSSSSCEAQQKAIELAERLGATIDHTSSVCHGPTIVGTQDTGWARCTLGEVKNRADLIIFWGANPAEAHPRHVSRYVSQEGLFRKKGERTIVLVDVRKTASAAVADQYVKIEPGSDFEVLSLMRQYLRRGTPIREEFRDLVDAMKACQFGVLFFGLGLTMSKGKHINVDAALRLAKDLNDYTKFSIIPMRGHYNVTGAGITLAWATGYPFAVNFARGYPVHNPGEFTAVDVLKREECDAALILAADPLASFPAEAWKHLTRIPTIVMDPKVSLTSRAARVTIPVAVTGIEAEGTAYRMDGVPLRLKQVVDSPWLPDTAVLSSLIERVGA